MIIEVFRTPSHRTCYLYLLTFHESLLCLNLYTHRPLLYSITGIGSAIMNDFKSVEGDTKFGLKSIPVMYGFDKARDIVILTQNLPQLAVATYLFSIGESIYAIIVLSLIVPQIYFQMSLLMEDPLQNDVQYVEIGRAHV